MLPIHQLLARFKGLTNTDKTKKEKIVSLLLKKNIVVSPKQIFFSNKTIIIKTNAIIKTEILLRKEEILNEIRGCLEESEYLEIQ